MNHQRRNVDIGLRIPWLLDSFTRGREGGREGGRGGGLHTDSNGWLIYRTRLPVCEHGHAFMAPSSPLSGSFWATSGTSSFTCSRLESRMCQNQKVVISSSLGKSMGRLDNQCSTDHRLQTAFDANRNMQAWLRCRCCFFDFSNHRYKMKPEDITVFRYVKILRGCIVASLVKKIHQVVVITSIIIVVVTRMSQSM
jgi:hypothetical protein